MKLKFLSYILTLSLGMANSYGSNIHNVCPKFENGVESFNRFLKVIVKAKKSNATDTTNERYAFEYKKKRWFIGVDKADELIGLKRNKDLNVQSIEQKDSKIEIVEKNPDTIKSNVRCHYDLGLAFLAFRLENSSFWITTFIEESTGLTIKGAKKPSV